MPIYRLLRLAPRIIFSTMNTFNCWGAMPARSKQLFGSLPDHLRPLVNTALRCPRERQTGNRRSDENTPRKTTRGQGQPKDATTSAQVLQARSPTRPVRHVTSIPPRLAQCRSYHSRMLQHSTGADIFPCIHGQLQDYRSCNEMPPRKESSTAVKLTPGNKSARQALIPSHPQLIQAIQPRCKPHHFSATECAGRNSIRGKLSRTERIPNANR